MLTTLITVTIYDTMLDFVFLIVFQITLYSNRLKIYYNNSKNNLKIKTQKLKIYNNIKFI